LRPRRRPITGWAALAGALLLAAAEPALAQFPGDVPDTFRLSVGGMYAWFSTDVTFQENLTPGGPIGGGINMEDLLHQPSSRPGLAARGYWHFFDHFYLDFGYVGFWRSRTESIAQDISFDSVTYTAGASVKSSMNSQLPYLDLRWNFIQSDSFHLGVTLGAAYPILQAKLAASGGVVGPAGPIISQDVEREAKIQTLVPLLGLLLDARLGDRLSAGIIFNGIFAPVHPYVGSVFYVEPHIDWFLSKNFGVGGAFMYTKFNIKKEETLSLIDFSYSYYGPKVYVTVTF
jgi:hypothetical protein